MKDDMTPVAVTILGKEYRIACSPEERDELIASARNLDAKMREIRDSGRVIGTERIAVMAALNLAHELTQQQTRGAETNSAFSERLAKLREKIDAVLRSGEFK